MKFHAREPAFECVFSDAVYTTANVLAKLPSVAMDASKSVWPNV
jgi:hypothetical protein